jgi:SAM-dependent methyltransferase
MPGPDPDSFPFPEGGLLGRIGPMGDEDPVGTYRESGRLHRLLLEDTLPDDWTWAGKRTLDFGCGVGRVLRRFAPETDEAEFYGCDLDTPSIEWLQKNLAPPFKIFESHEEPGLPQEDDFFDLVYCYSVYTHFTDNWAGWLHEHHRVLKPGGYLFATILGPGMLEPLTGEEWDEDRIGMNPLLHGFPWDQGGPIAINSPWWIRAHWGRAFDLEVLTPALEEGKPSHGIVLARKKPVALTVEDLTRLEPDEPRELAALSHHVEQLAAESKELREASVNAETSHAARLEQELESIKSSASWKLTAPLRAGKSWVAERRAAR